MVPLPCSNRTGTGSRLGVRGVMFHTGSAASQPDRVTALKVAIDSLNKILDDIPGRVCFC